MPEEEVNHPKRYNSDASGVECIEVVESLPHNLSRAVEYCWRLEHKGSPTTDLKKALWYLNRARQKGEEVMASEVTSKMLRVLFVSDNHFLRTLLFHLLYRDINVTPPSLRAFLVVKRKLIELGGEFDASEYEPVFSLAVNIPAEAQLVAAGLL